MTLKDALNAAKNAGFLYVTDKGTNSDEEIWCIDECGNRWDLDAKTNKTYELNQDGTISEYDQNGNNTGWYLECTNEWPNPSDSFEHWGNVAW